MAHKKSAGSTRNGRDSQSKRLGVKVFGGQKVKPGMILVRQRGTKFHPGNNTKITGDDTIISLVEGVLEFIKIKTLSFNGNLVKRVYLRVRTAE